MTQPGPFTTPQIAEILQVPLRKIMSYIEREYIRPSEQDASGYGSKRLWSYDDVVVCAVVNALDKCLSVKAARHFGRVLRDPGKTKKGMFLTVPISLEPSEMTEDEYWSHIGGAFTPQEIEAFKRDFDAYKHVGLAFARGLKPETEDEKLLEAVEIKISMSKVHEWVSDRIRECEETSR